MHKEILEEYDNLLTGNGQQKGKKKSNKDKELKLGVYTVSPS